VGPLLILEGEGSVRLFCFIEREGKVGHGGAHYSSNRKKIEKERERERERERNI